MDLLDDESNIYVFPCLIWDKRDRLKSENEFNISSDEYSDLNLLIVVDETDNLTTVRRVRRKTGNINNTTFELCSY